MISQDKPELKFKILIIGNTAVGKTSMILKYVDNEFPEAHMATIGVEFKNKTIETNKYKVTLNIWDTAGQERFRSLTKSFFNNANGIIFVYDITKEETFEGVKNWMRETEPYKFESILCGNKLDLQGLRKVKYDTLKEFGLKKKMVVFETSAKTGQNLQEAFEKLADLIIKSKSHEELINEFGVKSGENLSLSKSNRNFQSNKSCCIK